MSRKYFFNFKNAPISVEVELDRQGHIDGGLIVKAGDVDISDLIEHDSETWYQLIDETYEAINEEHGGR